MAITNDRSQQTARRPGRDSETDLTAEPIITQAPVVEVSGVNYAFGSGKSHKQVLFDNYLRLQEGELIVITGPSGSGKTTLLTLIGALRSIQDGEIRVLGTGLHDLSLRQMERMRRQIGFIFQDHNLFEALTAYETVRLAMRLRRKNYSRSELKNKPLNLLRSIGLEEQIGSKPRAMSTGQKQRVAIARALINDPRLILADEPTAALDKERADQIIGTLRERASHQQTTILMVTHDPRIFDAADRVVHMVDGRIVREA